MSISGAGPAVCGPVFGESINSGHLLTLEETSVAHKIALYRGHW